jgi:hypothetical protein
MKKFKQFCDKMFVGGYFNKKGTIGLPKVAPFIVGGMFMMGFTDSDSIIYWIGVISLAIGSLGFFYGYYKK